MYATWDWRSSNALSLKLKTLHRRLRPDGRVPMQLKYAGAHTCRWSGSGGFNFQNMTRGEAYGVDLRGLFIPKPGHKFVICDLSQIEPRCQYWLADDEKMLEALRSGVPLYEAHARATMNWKGGPLKTEDPKLYQLAKARVLAMGYKLVKPQTLVASAKSMAGYDLTLTEAAKQIEKYALQNPLIVAMWDRFEKELSDQVASGEMIWGLMSGRKLIYRNFKRGRYDGRYTHGYNDQHQASVQILTENVVQATARDVLPR